MHGHFTDFVQKQGAALGLFKQTLLIAVRAGKGAFFVAKQHVLDQVFRHGGAIEGHKRTACTGRRLVQHPGHDFFARTGWTNQQGRHIGLCHFFGQGQQVLAGWIHKHHMAHGLNDGANAWGAQVGVQAQPRSAAHIVCGQDRHRTALAGFYCQLERLTLDTRHHGCGQSCFLQQLLHGLQAGDIQTQVQHHHGRIGRLRNQRFERGDRHQGPATGVQGLAVLGAQGFFRVQPEGQRGRCSNWLHGVASHSVGMCKATLVPAFLSF